MPFCLYLFLINWMLFSSQSIKPDGKLFQYWWMSLMMTNISLRGFSISMRFAHDPLTSLQLARLWTSNCWYICTLKWGNLKITSSMVLAWTETGNWIVVSLQNKSSKIDQLFWNHFWNKMPERLTLFLISKYLQKF